MLKLSYFPGEDVTNRRIKMRERYRNAVLSGNKNKARMIVLRETWTNVYLWAVRIVSLYLLLSKFRGS